MNKFYNKLRINKTNYCYVRRLVLYRLKNNKKKKKQSFVYTFRRVTYSKSEFIKDLLLNIYIRNNLSTDIKIYYITAI